jgi:hypothetical protein
MLLKWTIKVSLGTPCYHGEFRHAVLGPAGFRGIPKSVGEKALCMSGSRSRTPLAFAYPCPPPHRTHHGRPPWGGPERAARPPPRGPCPGGTPPSARGAATDASGGPAGGAPQWDSDHHRLENPDRGGDGAAGRDGVGAGAGLRPVRRRRRREPAGTAGVAAPGGPAAAVADLLAAMQIAPPTCRAHVLAIHAPTKRMFSFARPRRESRCSVVVRKRARGCVSLGR